MKQAEVKLSGRARKQVIEIQRWWKRNRLAAPRLFREELGHALEARNIPRSRLQTTAMAPSTTPLRPSAAVRRLGASA